MYEIMFTKLKKTQIKNYLSGDLRSMLLVGSLIGTDFLAFLHSDSIYQEEQHIKKRKKSVVKIPQYWRKTGFFTPFCAIFTPILQK